MMGPTHAATGVAAGLATLPLAPAHGPVASTAWVAVWAGAALGPDLDTHGSSAARVWGLPTRFAGALIGNLAKGHRMGTHDILIAPFIVATVAWVASWWAPTALAAVAVFAGLGQVALDPFLPGHQRRPLTNIAGTALVVVLVAANGVALPWLPVAAAGGWVVHILGDAVTTSGVPVPGAWLARVPRQAVPSWGLRWFHTGGTVERRIVAPTVDVLVLALFVLNVLEGIFS